MGHFSLVSNWRPHLSYFLLLEKSLLYRFLILTGLKQLSIIQEMWMNWVFLSYKEIIIRASKGSLPRLALKTVTPTEMKTQDTNASFCHWQVRNAEQLKREMYLSFAAPWEVCLLIGPNSLEQGLSLSWGFRTAIWLVLTFMKELQL